MKKILYRRNYEKMIKKLVWSFHYDSGIEYQELLSEALLTYVRALRDYEKRSKTKLSTYIYSRIFNRLTNFCKWWQATPEANTEELPSLSYVPDYEFFHQNIPAETAELITELLDNEEDYSQIKPKQARGRLIAHLREKGWAWSKIWRTFREIKNNLNEAVEYCNIRR